jgi:hypothetical protein
MGNFIDKIYSNCWYSFEILPASKQEKQAFSYYRAGMTAHIEVDMQTYYEALQVEEDPYDRSYTLYNIGLFTVIQVSILKL